MRLTLPRLLSRHSKLVVATTATALIAVATLAAQQFETFAPEFEGELWEMVGTVAPDDGWVNGVVFADHDGDDQTEDRLFVSDGDNSTIAVFDANLEPVDLPDADWAPGQSDDSSSPVYAWTPNQLSTATVQRAGETQTQTAILVSDLSEGAHRVLAFTTTGTHLFTLGLDSTGIAANPGFINGVAMGPAATFILYPDDKVQLIGSFAAAWSQRFRTVGGTLAYHGTADAPLNFDYSVVDDRFEGAPSVILTSAEPVVGLNDDAVPAREPFGLTFDTDGNLYITDSVTERLTVYGLAPAGSGPAFTRRFTFGTADPQDNGLTTIEFFQSYGIRFWPDEQGTGGRLFVSDAISNRVLAYRPNFADRTLNSIFALDGIGTLDGFPYALAIDPASGRIAIGDDYGARVEDEDGVPILDSDGYEQFLPRAWILKLPDVAAFDVQVFDTDGVTQVVCVGQPYTVKFSLTVPAGRSAVSGVEPQLIVDGTATTAAAVPGQAYPYPATLEPRDVMTFSYELMAPSTTTTVELEAGVNLGIQDGPHVLSRFVSLPISSCQAAELTVTATPSVAPQLSGWTSIRPAETFKVTLYATDPTGVRQINYRVDGANRTTDFPPVLNSDPALPSQTFDVWLPGPGLLPELGRTTVSFSAWNKDYVKFVAEPLELNLLFVGNRRTDEGTTEAGFSVGPPGPVADVRFNATGLPGDLTIDATTGLISGFIRHDSAGSHTVTVYESRGFGPTLEETSVTFHWEVLNVNVAPIVTADHYTVAEDTPLVVSAPGVLSNDSDEDGASLTASLDSGPSSGQLTLGQDGSFSYTPAPDFIGDVTFTYRASDGTANSEPATVTITIEQVNDAPSFTKGPDHELSEDAGAQSVPGWATDISAGAGESSQTVRFVVSNTNSALFTAGGQPAVSPTGTLSYTPAPNAFGVATVTVWLEDNGGTENGGVNSSLPVTFTITVNPVNDAPVAVPSTYNTVEGSTLSVPAPGVLAGASDAEGLPLTARLISGPASLALNPDGSFVYEPAVGFSGSVTFTYVASDGTLDSAPATVTITVNPSNRPPVCSATTVSPALLQWPPNHRKVHVTLSGITDPDGQSLTIRFTSVWQDEPTDGTGQGKTMQDGGIESNGATAWVRAERSGTGDGRVYLIGYTATDPLGASCSGQVTVGVPHDQRGTPPVLSPGRWNSLTGGLESAAPSPVAVNDMATVAKGGSTIIAVQANDVGNGSPLQVTIVSKPDKGTATVNATGTITYKAPKSTGTASFIYRITDSYGGTATATVTITVTS